MPGFRLPFLEEMFKLEQELHIKNNLRYYHKSMTNEELQAKVKTLEEKIALMEKIKELETRLRALESKSSWTYPQTTWPTTSGIYYCSSPSTTCTMGLATNEIKETPTNEVAKN
jgi:hypothetical protein